MSRSNRRVSSFEVARLAGVSRSAVSRTFTAGASVSEATRAKVRAAADALGYRPNAIARTLISRRSRIVAVVVTDLMNPFYARVLDMLSRVLQERGFTLLLVTASDEHHIDELVPTLLSYQVDGVVVASATLSSIIAMRCLQAGTPAVLVNRYTQNGQVPAVCCDNISGGEQAADLLLQCGGKTFAFIGGIEDTSSNRDRGRGFIGRLKARGVDRVGTELGEYTYEGGRGAARRLLLQDPRPDALFCANDMMALGAMDVARGELGLRVPEDLSIVGFDDIPTASLNAYALTTVVQDVGRMAHEAIDLLLASGRNPTLPTEKRLIPCRIEIRGSATPPGRTPTREQGRGRNHAGTPPRARQRL